MVMGKGSLQIRSQLRPLHPRTVRTVSPSKAVHSLDSTFGLSQSQTASGQLTLAKSQ